MIAVATWMVLGLGILGWAALVSLARRTSPARPIAPSALRAPSPTEVPPATMRLLFIGPTPSALVVDGLLDVGDASTGVPTAWALLLPDDPVLRAAMPIILRRWTDDGADVVVDLSRLDGHRRSVALSHGDTLLRLDVADPSSRPGGDDHVARA